MIVFPNAKINIGLNVTKKRADGFHNIETIFYPIPSTPGTKGRFCDVLEVIPSPIKESDSLQVTGTSEKIPHQDNLVIKALSLMRKEYLIPPVNIHLHKVIPSGAGLGGGSSDAAFMLTLLNKQFDLGLSTAELEEKASLLGADCAFFVRNSPTLAQGKGNEFTPVSLSLKDLWMTIVIPPIHLSTVEAYQNITPCLRACDIIKTVKKDPSEWIKSLGNDFEKYAFTLHPEIKKIKQTLYSHGALYASMSGSGSSVYGLFRKKPSIEWPLSFSHWCGKMK